MVKLEVIDTGELIDTSKAQITYVKQTADLANITTANASYSWNIEIPKTPHNTKIFENLGIVGDTSTIPYRRVYVRLSSSGVAIVPKGLLNVKDTGNVYNAHVQEGIIDFYKDVKDDKMGDVVNTGILAHKNDVQTITDSFTNPVWRYILADYNGPPLQNVPQGAAPTGNVTNLNPFSLIPSVNVKWLFDEVFKYYGWTYEVQDFDLAEIEETWLTYPTALAYDEDSVDLTNEFYVDGWAKELDGWEQVFYGRVAYNNTNLTNDLDHFEVANGDRTELRAKQNGVYRYILKLERGDAWSHFRYGIELNGVLQNPPIGSGSDTEPITTDLQMEAGDIIKIRIFVDFDLSTYQLQPFGEDTYFKIGLSGLTTVDFREALLRYKVSEFFKEVMIRHALTAFADTEERKILFMTMEERLTANVVDWSSKYVRRINESYVYDNYARYNYFRHKYDEENEEYFDGIFRVNNENLPTKKDLYESKTYAPEEQLVIWQGEFFGDFSVPSLRMYEIDVEVQINNDGSETVFGSYTPLRNRFHIIKSIWTGEKIYIAGIGVTGFPLASSSGCVFRDIVGERYRSASAVLTNTKVHEIELALSKYDVLTLDLTKQYYFKQESNFYLLNRLTYRDQEFVTGEFVRVIPNVVEVYVNSDGETIRICRDADGNRVHCDTGERYVRSNMTSERS